MNVNNNSMVNNEKKTNYHATLLLCYFFGVFGVHRFINGKVGTGILMLVTAGGCGLWVLIDLILIISGNFKNKDGVVVKSNKSFFATWSNIVLIGLFILGTISSSIILRYTDFDFNSSFGKDNDIIVDDVISDSEDVDVEEEEEEEVADTIQDLPVATLSFDDGREVVIELDANKAPNTVRNFITLADSGFYDGLTFHRIIEGFMIQGGDPQGTGMGGPGYTIEGEMANNGFKMNDLKHKRGTIAMARSQSYDSAGSQFFINVEDNSFLDDEYAVFGKVTNGYDIIEELSTVETDASDYPLEPVVIKSIVVDTKGMDYNLPDIIN